MTLIELLVVIVIITTIVAAAIPIMAPANDDRRLREASRGLNTFITGAQTRAIASGRPFGIALKRLSQDTNTDPDKNTDPNIDIHEDNGVCLEAFYVEQPPPFTGFVATSSVMVALDNGPTGQAGQVIVRFVARGNAFPPNVDRLPIGWDPDPFPPGVIRPGDVVEASGNQFRLTDTDVDATGFYTNASGNIPGRLVAVPLNDTGQLILPEFDNEGLPLREAAPPFEVPYWTRPASYKILRQPVPTSDQPHQLPDGTAIDLRASGVGINDYFYVPGLHDNSQGVIIMFTPEGRVQRVTFSRMPNPGLPFDRPVVDNIFLLLGKRENVPAPRAADADPTLDPATFSPQPPTEEQRQRMIEPINWLSASGRWVVIGPQSGRVVTVENAFADPLAVMNDPQPPFAAAPKTEAMRTRQILAAREFTREMSQLGGG